MGGTPMPLSPPNQHEPDVQRIQHPNHQRGGINSALREDPFPWAWDYDIEEVCLFAKSQRSCVTSFSKRVNFATIASGVAARKTSWMNASFASSSNSRASAHSCTRDNGTGRRSLKTRWTKDCVTQSRFANNLWTKPTPY